MFRTSARHFMPQRIGLEKRQVPGTFALVLNMSEHLY
jgi:hypothetical protein